MIRMLLAALLLTISCAINAAPQTYSFSTGASPFGALPPSFSSSDFVAGTFTYDPLQTTFTGTDPFGSTFYVGSVRNLSASVHGIAFSDIVGNTSVGNEVSFPPTLINVDSLQINLEPPLGLGTHDLSLFVIDGYTLVNVRMFWIETLLGIGDFLDDQNLPAALPAFEGRLALDFLPPTGGSDLAFVFFDGLFLRPEQQIPEPGILGLLAAGLAGLCFARRRKLH